jgi:two-component system nitrogen regulation sensor histidine kinase GlnL
MLAHEVKNPLSGIRGAAQLLEQNAVEDDRELCVLIQDEADRIRNLVERMEMFSDRPIEQGVVNIHEVLDHVRRIASRGFASHLRIVEDYDPSLPPVWGNRDFLIQIMLNLVKNASEAVDPQGGEISFPPPTSPASASRCRARGAGAPALAGQCPRQRPRHR